jgi:hypothetical protein
MRKNCSSDREKLLQSCQITRTIYWNSQRSGQFLKQSAFLTCKAELQLEGIFFALNFLPWEFLSVKKLEIEKTKTTKYTTFKTDIIKVILVFSISIFFTNENFQGRKLSAV